jgi:indole-3-glycerol phosphate synthase
MLPKNVIIVAESGISDFDTVKRLHDFGVDAFLVGEYIMRKKDLKKAVKNLKGG